MELEIRQYFIVSELRNTGEDTCARITDTLLSNDNLCAHAVDISNQYNNTCIFNFENGCQLIYIGFSLKKLKFFKNSLCLHRCIA